MIKVYAKLENTKDQVLLKFDPKTNEKDIVIYRDSECKSVFCRFLWFKENKPNKTDKTIMLNCYLWELVWI